MDKLEQWWYYEFKKYELWNIHKELQNHCVFSLCVYETNWIISVSNLICTRSLSPLNLFILVYLFMGQISASIVQ